jgi:hypothetical protein
MEAFEEGLLSVSYDDSGAHYAIHAPDGNVVDEGDGWSGLVSRLEVLFGDSSEKVIIICP